ncbi:MAG: helix-turn-helix domain-containing protein [Methyloprofundus sp.]|nr:helix-turn-helix domain-containing protein [Methyloprofundus sp.]
MKAYLTPAEAAEYAGISKSLLSKHRQSGTGCPYIRVGDSKTKAKVLYKKTEIDKWLNNFIVKTTGS